MPGLSIRIETVQNVNKTTSTVSETKHATSYAEVQLFLGLSTVFRRFETSFFDVTAPLNKEFRKNEPTQLRPLSAAE